MSAVESQFSASVLAERMTRAEPHTVSLAASLAAVCRAGDCVLLEGDLGAGKTAFARGFIKALSPECGEVTSPTFTLVQTYTARDGITISHFDLYRLEEASELAEIGLDEALQSTLALVEWPAVALGWFPPEALHVAITIMGDDARRFTFSGLPVIWEERLKHLT